MNAHNRSRRCCLSPTFAFLALFTFQSTRADEQALTDVMGLWATTGFGSTVRLKPCNSGQTPIELCGTITWLWEPFDDKGAPRLDARNPEKSSRERPLVGTRILSGFRLDNNGVWRGGAVYNPDDGRSYSGTIRSMGGGSLELKGCALKVFCQTQTWRRAAEVCASAGEG
jgi:uncharacterized protein (DUF2147 family)